MSEPLLPYYDRELAFIRSMGDEFGAAYPKIAGRLRFAAGVSDDPHVERLIEAFAFLTARIRKKLDDDFPEIAEAMLEVLHPYFLAPIPAFTIVQFILDETAGKLTTSYRVPRHSTLETEASGGAACRFRTCYPVELWPLEVKSAQLAGPPFRAPETPGVAAAKSVLHLNLNCLNQDVPLGDIGVSSLRFFLSGQKQYTHALYELIFNDAIEVVVANGPEDRNPQILDLDCLKPVGFDEGEELLPATGRSGRYYQVLTEYFAFSDKHLFFDIDGLAPHLQSCRGRSCDLYISMRREIDEAKRYVSAKTFRLGCTPAVNLFQHTAEPIRVDHERSEYEVLPTARRAAEMEVYSIDRVTATMPGGEVLDVPPLFGLKHGVNPDSTPAFWVAARRTGRRRPNQEDTGTDVFLSLVDLEFDPAKVSDSVLTVETTCSNRDLTTQLPFGGGRPGFALDEDVASAAGLPPPKGQAAFKLEQGGPFLRIDCLVHPTPPRRAERRRGALWRLVAQLTLGHLSVTQGEHAAQTLCEMLRLYDFAGESASDPFKHAAIANVSSRRVVGRIRPDKDLYPLRGARGVEPGFCRGLEITLELDEEKFVGSGEYLFACVLERFFAMYTSMNSFTKLILRTKQRKELRRWPPRAGEKILH